MDRRNFVLRAVTSAGTLALSHEPAIGSEHSKINVAIQSSYLAEQASARFDPPQFITWDGGSGPNREFWSQKLMLRWANPGTGDWLDAMQTAQGRVPFASALVADGIVVMNVTNLVNRWLTTGENRGFYLRSNQAWPYVFAGRTNSLQAARPRLDIVTDHTTTQLPCSSNAMWSPSSYQSKDSRAIFEVAQGNQFAVLQFDLSAVTGPVQSALLVLNCLSFKYPGSLDAFELNPPTFRNGNGGRAAQLGIANGYAFDRGITSHPDVVFASDFSDISRRVWQSGGIANGSSQVVDTRTGTVQLRGLIPKGQLLGCDLERSLVSGSANGTPTSVENELYARYYVLLEDDWGSEVDANKMPGWDGRFGWWNSIGYWQATTGNGGVRPTGMKVRDTNKNRWEFQGASMRGHGGTRANDGNPYDDLFWIGSYVYHLDQPTNYGESIVWPGMVIGKGRWYCIEQHIKMNSITGPIDSLGNGTAVKDGRLRVWVDGVLAYERNDFRWRRYPEIGIQGFWLNWYHGGVAVAPSDMHFRMDSVVIARKYIGPRNESV